MREDGFYWILFEREWQVAEWSSNFKGWLITGMEGFVRSRVEEVDERRVYRDPPLKFNQEKFKALITGTSPWKQKAEGRLEKERLDEWQRIIDSSDKWDDGEIIRYMKENFNPPTKLC